uniref:amino acid adenylation domain-containing protein n=1 Tax=Pricia sp. TaxID=2268138 RepID=UPI0035938AC1
MTQVKDKYIPLTQSQLSLWTGQRMHPGSPLHNVVYTFDISGDLSTLFFKNAFQTLIDRTDVLRTVITEKDGIPYQFVLQKVDYPVETIDFTTESDEQVIKDWILERTQAPLELSEQLFDSVLLKLGDSRYIWFLKIHHLVTDAVSNALLYRRMESLYQIRSNQKLDDFGETTSFADYVFYEGQQRSDAKNEASQAYWKGKTANRPGSPKLYGKKENGNSTATTRVSAKLGTDRTSRLRELAKRPEIRSWTEDLSLFTLFATVYSVYLHRVSGENCLAIGVPAHNRAERQFQKTVGLFIEVLPIFVDIAEDDTFLSVLKRVKTETNAYLRHAHTGAASADIGRSFNTVLNYIQADFPDFNGFPTQAEWVHNGHMDNSHALRCHMYAFNGKNDLELAFDLNKSVFPAAIEHYVPDHFLRLFDALLDDIDQPIGNASMISPKERELLAAEQKENPETSFSVLQSFEQQVVQRPNAIALQYDGEILTYSTLNKRANQLAHYLKNQGIIESSKVGLHLYRSSEYIIAVLAILKTGAAFIPIASDQPSDRIGYMLLNSGCSIVITDKKLREKLAGDIVSVLDVSSEKQDIAKESSSNLGGAPLPDNLAYVLYTSGSTGRPKGVLITHRALSNYMGWAGKHYGIDEKSIFPLFTSIGFDLTLTSTFLPLLNGGRIIVYKEMDEGPDLSLLRVIEDDLVNTIKATPSHLALLQGRNLDASQIRTLIVGGEDFKVQLAKSTSVAFGPGLKIFNEYGPTEATVGCIVSEYEPEKHTGTSLPIGIPIIGMQAYVLDNHLNLVPKGVIGELYLSGTGLANGYVNAEEITASKFVDHPFIKNSKMYRTGDLARINAAGDFEYLGRIDNQVKLRGHRIELSDIEANMAAHPEIENCTVVVVSDRKTVPENEVVNCVQCGLPSNYPEIEFNEQGVCQLCTSFSNYEDKVKRYFKNDDELVRILTSKRLENPTYDCISLLSGGKDSTYVLGRLIDMGLRVLAFTMDNGYISDQAKENIDHIVTQLGVDHVYGETPHMNEIFVDSLHRHHNVCNGCFKTIYTLSTQIALEKKIPFILTGLSRGQFFETRLTEELFWEDTLDTTKIDDTILEARKLYHREQDAVKRLLDVSAFEDDTVFEKVQFVDFYRYSDVSLEELLIYLKDKLGWVRPTDTGRSTNCLINQVGIYVHKKEEGYSNYAFPYSWDVRLGHKRRDESLVEINEAIDETEVQRIMEEIGYERSEADQQPPEKLVAYFTGNPDISVKDLRQYLANKLPAYMVPTLFKYMDEIPLTKNGKVDKNALENLSSAQLSMDTPYTAPRNEIEELLEGVWKEVLQLKKVGVHDDFIALGGHSLAAIRVTARINEEIEVDFPLNKIFERPT